MMRNLAYAILASWLSASAVANAQLVGIDRSGKLYEMETDGGLNIIGDTGIPSVNGMDYNAADGFLYAVSSPFESELYRIDPKDATKHFVGRIRFPFDVRTYMVTSLAIAVDGSTFATGWNTNNGKPLLYQVDPNTALAQVVGEISGAHVITQLEARDDGMLIGIDQFLPGALVTIDPVTVESRTIIAIDPRLHALGDMALVDDSFGYIYSSGVESPPAGLSSFNPYNGSVAFVAGVSPIVRGTGIGGIAYVPEPSGLALAAIALVAAPLLARRNWL